MQAWGHSRFTRDLDMVLKRSARDRVVAFAESQGYETLHLSEGYSNHLHADSDLGRVDFMYVNDETAEKLFAGVTVKPIIGNVEAPVPRPEHLAAMKAISMKNSPQRVLMDSPDVQFLLRIPGINRQEIRDYFARQGLLEVFDAIAKRS